MAAKGTNACQSLEVRARWLLKHVREVPCSYTTSRIPWALRYYQDSARLLWHWAKGLVKRYQDFSSISMISTVCKVQTRVSLGYLSILLLRAVRGHASNHGWHYLACYTV